jgi:adenylyltransferase/sulfurtransferase
MLDAQTLQSRVIKTGRVTKTNITNVTNSVDIPIITAHELKNNISSGIYTLVDVRNGEERAAFNIGGEHVPLELLESVTAFFEDNKPVVFYCASGKRSAEAVKIISKKLPGIIAYSLEGGMKAWKDL